MPITTEVKTMKSRPQSQSPVTQPSADLSPRGRGEKKLAFPLSGVKAISDRPRPNGERDGVRGRRCSPCGRAEKKQRPDTRLDRGSGDGAPSYKSCRSRLCPATFLAVSRDIEKKLTFPPSTSARTSGRPRPNGERDEVTPRQSPLTRPAAVLSPRGRGEKKLGFPPSSEKATSDRPRPYGERDGVRGRRSARGRQVFVLAFAWIVAHGFAQAFAASPTEGLTIFPSECVLTTPESRQPLIAQEIERGEVGRQLVRGIAWSSSDPKIATVADGIVIPVHDGQVTITAKAGAQTATAKVVVQGMNVPFDWTFRHHVEPILAKQGCNSGACHGALAGKGGFKLSLRGYDPTSDFFNIVKQDRGRRVELADPGRSLLLAKPSGAIAHKGGVRFGTNTLEYRILSEWISRGAAPPSEGDSRVEQLQILPDRSFQRVGASQQILVRARYSDGRAEDVTPWVKWSSADESVCRVDEQGQTQVIGPGEGAIVAWYASKLAIARVTVPYQYQGQPAQAASTVDRRKPRNFIDEQIDKQLARLNLPPSAPCGDAEFVRRATSIRSAACRRSTRHGPSWPTPRHPAAMH